MSEELLELLHQRQHAYAQFLRDRSTVNELRFKQLRNQFKAKVRIAKRQYFADGAKSGGKFFWSNIKMASGIGRQKRKHLPWPAATREAAFNSANMINDFFISSVSHIVESMPAALSSFSVSSPDSSSNSSFSINPITLSDVLRAIRELPADKANGADNISITMLKKSCDAIAPIVTDLFNRSVRCGIFPDCLKQALVVPIHKKGDTCEVSNYRPVALLSSVSKLFEKLVHRQLSAFLYDYHILSDKQHGFCKGLSCKTALCRLSGLLSEAKRLKKESVLVTIDFARAFDTLNFDILLSALESYHFSTLTIQWFRSYLTGRSQQTIYANERSSFQEISSGVPEGSLLGPVLFNLYINSLLHLLPKDRAVAYADDITLVCSGSVTAIITQMQSTLDTVYEWALVHKLKLNISKCFAMYVRAASRSSVPDGSQRSLMINGSQISWVDETKILGVTFNSSLCWMSHSNNIRAKISRMSGVLQRFGGALDSLTRKRLFQAFILPHFLFCLPVWGNLELSSCRALDNCLLRCARLIQRKHNVAFNNETFNATGILPFQSFVLLRNATAVFNILRKDESDMYLYATLFTNSTRQADSRKFIQNHVIRKCDLLQFAPSAIVGWNGLPNAVTVLTDFNKFLSSLYTHICSQLD
jgi:hypothetical protein